MIDFYQILGVSRDATPSEIKIAYKRLASMCHPDKHPQEFKAEFTKKMAEINDAYAFLGSKEKRKWYDDFSSTNSGATQSASEAWNEFMAKAKSKSKSKSKAKPQPEPSTAEVIAVINYANVKEEHFCRDCAGSGKLRLAAGYQTKTLACPTCLGIGIKKAVLNQYWRAP